jgi:hypothetical protein
MCEFLTENEQRTLGIEEGSKKGTEDEGKGNKEKTDRGDRV